MSDWILRGYASGMVRERAAILTVLALLGAGCSTQSTAAGPTITPVGLVTHVLPGCTTAAQEGPVVSVRDIDGGLCRGTVGVVHDGDGRWAFVSLTGAAHHRRAQGRGVARTFHSTPGSRRVAVGLLGEALMPVTSSCW